MPNPTDLLLALDPTGRRGKPTQKTPEEELLEQQAGMSRPGPGAEQAGQEKRPTFGLEPYNPVAGRPAVKQPNGGYMMPEVGGEGRGRWMEYQQPPGGQPVGPGPIGAAKPGPSVLDTIPMPRPATDPVAALMAANQPTAKAGPASVLDVRPQWGQMTSMGGRDYAYTTDKTGFKTDLIPADQLTPEAVTRLQWRQAYNDRLPGLGAKIPAGFNATQGDIWQAQQDNINLGNAAAGADAFLRQTVLQQKADADRSLASSQFDQNQTLAQADLAARRGQEQQRLDQQRQEMLLRLDPAALRAQAMTQAAVAAGANPDFDMKAFLDTYGGANAANEAAYGRATGAKSAVPGVAPLTGTVTPPPGTGYVDARQRADAIVSNVMGHFGTAIPRKGGGTDFDIKEVITPEMIDNAASAVAASDMSDPEVAKQVREGVQRMLGAKSRKVLEPLMQQMATNALLDQPPGKDKDGRYAGTYERPGSFKLQEKPGFGRGYARAMAGNVPYNEIVLPDGTTLPYNAKDYMVNPLANPLTEPFQWFGKVPAWIGEQIGGPSPPGAPDPRGRLLSEVNRLDDRAKAARQQLPRQSALLRLLIQNAAAGQ